MTTEPKKSAPKTNGGANEEKELKPLTKSAIQLREMKTVAWWLGIPAGTPTEHLKRPELWPVLAQMLNRWDTIFAFWSDGSRFAEILVLAAGVGIPTRVQILRVVELEKVESTYFDGVPPGYELVQDENGFWGALRQKDNVLVIREKPERKVALRELLEHNSLRGT
jgi:hypothetical protein